MNPREKLLATCMAAVLILGGLVAVVRWGVMQRWQTLNKNIHEAQRDQTRLSGRLEEARAAEQDWCDLKPLSRGAHGAEQRFRGDIGQLLKDHGLDDKCTVSTRAARKLKSGFPEVRLSIQLQEATLRQVLGFLSDFYRREYLAKLDQVTLMVAEQGGRDRGERVGRDGKGGRRRSAAARRNPDDPKLNVNMTATALVLPVIKAIDADKQRPTAPIEPPEGFWGRGRPLSEYDPILASNLFREKLPEPARVTVGPTTTRPVAAGAGGEPLPPPPPPPPSKKIVGVTSTSGKLAVYVRDEDRLERPPEKVELNDPLHDGTLVLVLTRGVVVQVPDENADAYKYYFYRLGATFAEREALDRAQDPEIFEQIEWALGR